MPARAADRNRAVAAITAALTAQTDPAAGYSAQRVGHATIVAELRRLGLDALTARVLADRSQRVDVSPSNPLTPAMAMAHGRGPAARAAYLVAAADRLAAKPGLDQLDQMTAERRHLNAHVAAQQGREQAALRTDAAAAAYGPLLGWNARHDDRTTPECRAADGRNYRADLPPALGLPGLRHGARCRCLPGPPHPGARTLPPAQAGGNTISTAREGDAVAIELAENKTLPDGSEVTKSGLHYNPKTKTFRPATDAEKAAGKKGGDFNSKHPRAAAGTSGGTGGQFVPLGAARDSQAAQAQKDPKAQTDYRELLTGKGDRRIGLRTLDDRRLGALSRALYSSRTANPSVVAARTLVADELARRGMDVTKFGALGGTKPGRAARAVEATRPPAAKPPPAAKAVSTAGLTKQAGAVVLDSKVSEPKRRELIAAGWKGRPGDSREALYPPPGVTLARLSRAIELSAKTGALASASTPLGKPGGPGLFGDTSLHLPDYVRNVAKAIMRGGRTKSQAIAIALGRIRGWATGRDEVSPEVRAASVKAIAQWDAARAKARATPNRTDLSCAVEAIELAARNGQHVPGTPYEWKHGYIPLTAQVARRYGKRKHAERLEQTAMHESKAAANRSSSDSAVRNAQRMLDQIGSGKTVFTKGRDGRYRVIGPAADVQPGATVTVSRMDGTETSVRVGRTENSGEKQGIAFNQAFVDNRPRGTETPTNATHTLPTLTATQTAKFTKMARAIRKTLYVYELPNGKIDATHSGAPRQAHIAFHRDGTTTKHDRRTAADDHAELAAMRERAGVDRNGTPIARDDQ